MSNSNEFSNFMLSWGNTLRFIRREGNSFGDQILTWAYNGEIKVLTYSEGDHPIDYDHAERLARIEFNLEAK